MISPFYQFCLSCLLNYQVDTIKIPFINSETFVRATNIVYPLNTSSMKMDSLTSAFDNKISFKYFILDRKANLEIFPLNKVEVFVGHKDNSIYIGCDINSNGMFEKEEISIMPEENKRIITYKIYPSQIFNSNAYVDSSIIHLIPFNNQVKYTDLSATDSMLQLTYSRGYNKIYIINDTLQLATNVASIKRIDSSLISRYTVISKSGISVISADRDLLNIGKNFYAINKNLNKDTLYLSLQINNISGSKVSFIPPDFFTKMHSVNFKTSKTEPILFDKKIIVLDFWGTWCVPCIKSMPHLKEMYKKYKDKVQMISFCIDNTQNFEKAKKIINKNKIKWQQYFVESNSNLIYSLLTEYGIINFPTYILIDEKGNVIKIISEADKIDLSGF